MIKSNEVITIDSYAEICDYVYKPGCGVPSGLVHVNLEEFPHFCTEIKEFPDRKYVVVSSRSDFGVCYQQEHPVAYDAIKWCDMQVTPEAGYRDIKVEARCNRDSCHLEDTYSVKCYSFTSYTFNEIPENITHWYMTNCGIWKHPKITHIPFGVPKGKAEIIAEKSAENHERNKLLFIQWGLNTRERFDLLKFYIDLSYDKWATIIESPKDYEKYLEELSEHFFVVCPSGNGIDCYRVAESIYMGAYPIVSFAPIYYNLPGCNILMTKRFEIINQSYLYDILSKDLFKGNNLMFNLTYWKDRFYESKSLL